MSNRDWLLIFCISIHYWTLLPTGISFPYLNACNGFTVQGYTMPSYSSSSVKIGEYYPSNGNVTASYEGIGWINSVSCRYGYIWAAISENSSTSVRTVDLPLTLTSGSTTCTKNAKIRQVGVGGDSVTGVTVSPKTTSVDVGDTKTLTATVLPRNATNKSVTWSSSNNSVATVSSNGTITPVGGGTAVITVTTVDGGYTDTCTVTVNDPYNGYEYVDLGLPSGTKWAKMNVGATSEEKYGNYYMFGGGTSIWPDAYRYVGDENPIPLSTDTARQSMGGEWKTPSSIDFEELVNNTTFNPSATINGVKGGKFTAPNGKYVFFPYAGFTEGNDHGIEHDEFIACLWTSNPVGGDGATAYEIQSDGNRSFDNNYRFWCFSVRGIVKQ